MESSGLKSRIRRCARSVPTPTRASTPSKTTLAAEEATEAEVAVTEVGAGMEATEVVEEEEVTMIDADMTMIEEEATMIEGVATMTGEEATTTMTITMVAEEDTIMATEVDTKETKEVTKETTKEISGGEAATDSKIMTMKLLTTSRTSKIILQEEENVQGPEKEIDKVLACTISNSMAITSLLINKDIRAR